MSDLVQRLRKRSTDEPFRRGDPALYAEAADRIEQHHAELAELRAALVDARDDVADWAAYASEYFQEKWNLAGDLARIDAVLSKYRQDDDD